MTTARKPSSPAEPCFENSVEKLGETEKTKEGSLGSKDSFPLRHFQTWSSGSFSHDSSSQTDNCGLT